MKQFSVLRNTKHQGFMVIIIILLLLPVSVFAFGGSDKDTNIRNVVCNDYINDRNGTIDKYVQDPLEVSWEAPEHGAFDQYLYVIFLDDNGDGKLNGESDVFYLSTNSVNPTGGGDIYDQLVVGIRGEGGSEQVIASSTKLLNRSKELKCDFLPRHSDKKIGVIIASYLIYQENGYYPPRFKLNADHRSEKAIVDYYPPLVPEQPILVKRSFLEDSPYKDGCYYVNDKSILFWFTSFKDTGAGMYEYQIHEDGTLIPSSRVELYDPFTDKRCYDITTEEGRHIYTVTGVDYFGREAKSAPYPVVCDITPPSIKIYGAMKESEWTHLPSASIRANATDANIDTDSIYYTIETGDNPKWTKGDSFNGTLKDTQTDGSYNCRFKAVDKAGNETTGGGYFNIDRIAPTMSGTPSLSFVEGSPIKKLKVNWTKGSDETSGIDYYVVCYRTALIDGQYPAEYQQNGNHISPGSSLTDIVTLAGLSRATSQKIQVAIKAVDKSGLANTSGSAEIILPATVEGEVTSSALEPGALPDTPTIAVNIELHITKTRALADYDSITYTRVSATNRTPLPGDDVLPKTITIKNTEFNALEVNPSTQCLTIVDMIPSSSGAGHKYIRYAFSSKPKNASFIENNSVCPEYLLPNIPGTITWKLIDANGHELQIDKNGSEVYRDPDFKIYTDGKVLVSFHGEDLDQEPWTIELDRTKKVKASPYDLISYQRISGKNVTAYTTKTGMQPTVEYPVTLSYGTNTLLFIWDEGRLTPDNNLDTQKSAAVSIILDAPMYGIYSLRVTDEYANYDSSGIYVRPGENLTIEVSAPEGSDNTYAWDFGDGASATTQEVEHIYGQRSGKEQLTDSTVYSLQLDIAEASEPSVVTTIPLDVTVRDTQEGELFTSEVWRGAHTLTGTVVVPSGMTLTVGSSAMETDMVVSSIGGPGAGYNQGIHVMNGGVLTVDADENTVVFTKTEGQEQGWGTLFIDTGATATISESVIEYADRGVTANEGSSVSITGSTIRQNNIGVHVLGGSSVTILNSSIIENAVYGVKEERNATPVLRANSIFENLRDYYEWDLGPITVDVINLKPNCRDNRGE